MKARLSFLPLLLIALSALLSCSKNNVDHTPVHSAWGTVWDAAYFLIPPMKGAEVSIVEYPGRKVIADSAGHFRFDGLKEGSQVTFRILKQGYLPYYTETYTIDTTDLGPVAIQAANLIEVAGFAYFSESVPDMRKGFIASTVSTQDPATFVNLGFPGEAGCTVSIDPPLPPELGPIYFDEQTLPRRYLTETTRDGGILYVNVPPGEYTIYAHKSGIEFRPIKVKVFAGALTNATPPFGLRKLR